MSKNADRAAVNHSPHTSTWLRHAEIARPWWAAHPTPPPRPPHPRPPWTRLLAAAAFAGAWLWLIACEIGERVAPHEAFPLGTALALGFALAFARRPRRARRVSAAPFPYLALLLAVFAAGVLARTLYLTSFPPLDGQLWEECQTGTVAEGSILTGGLDLFFPLTNLIAEAGFRFYGQTMIGLRLPFVLLSVLSIVLFHAAARQLLRTRGAALVATALFATSAYLGAAGRVALESMAPIATLCTALLATFYACRTRSLTAFALTGLSGGLLLLEYTSYKLYAPLLFATAGLAALAAPPDRPGLYPEPPWSVTLWFYRWHFAVLLFACAAVIVPVFAQNPVESLQILGEGVTRNRTAIEQGGLAASWQVWAHAAQGRLIAAFRQIFLGAGSPDLLPPTSGLVDPVTGVLGLFGLAYCAGTARRDARRLFLTVTVLLTVVLAGLLVDIVQRYRLTPLVPLYFLAIAVPLDDLFAARPEAVGARLWSAVAVAAIGAYNLYFLFHVAMRDPTVLAEFGDHELALAREIAAVQRQHPGEPVYVATASGVMHQANDYSWLYDLAGVHSARSRDELLQATGSVIADGDFIAEVRALPRARDCVETRKRLGNRPLHWIRCRLDEEE